MIIVIYGVQFKVDGTSDEALIGGIATMLSEAIEATGLREVIRGCWWRYGGLPVYDGDTEIARVTVYG